MDNLSPKTKLAFITPKISVDSGVALGIIKKIRGQIHAFEKLSFDVRLFDFPPYRFGDSNFLADLLKAKAYTRQNYTNCLEQIIQYQPNAVYIRYNFSDSHFIGFLKELRESVGANTPIFLEIATYPYDRELLSSKRPGLLYLYFTDLLYRGNLRHYIDRVVTFSDFPKILSIPTVATSNGVDTEAIQPMDNGSDMDNQNKYHLIGVSNLTFWTGYERILQGLSDYKNTSPDKTVYFHIVGDGSSLPDLKNKVKREELADNVIFHGALSGDALDRVFQNGHLAVGNLAVHRKGMTVNPDLKIREYCARGLPFVTSTIDPGFPPEFPFMLLAPPDESPIAITRLMDFLENLRIAHPDYRREIRQYAKEKLDWHVMLKPVATEMCSVIEGYI